MRPGQRVPYEIISEVLGKMHQDPTKAVLDALAYDDWMIIPRDEAHEKDNNRAVLSHLDGPALVYLTQDGIGHILDRLPPQEPGTAEARLSPRDSAILVALWETFTGRPQMLR